MNVIKVTKDQMFKWLLGKRIVPKELLELNRYFRLHGPINFQYIRSSDGHIVAKSTNFRFGSIITSGSNEVEVDKNIKDAILTSFEVPSAYAREAALCKEGTEKEKASYALA